LGIQQVIDQVENSYQKSYIPTLVLTSERDEIVKQGSGHPVTGKMTKNRQLISQDSSGWCTMLRLPIEKMA